MQISDSIFADKVLNSDRPVLVDFWASWCPPCKMMQPLVDRLHAEYDGKADILSLNIDQNPRAAAEYKIAGVPTFVVFNNGQEVQRKTGALTENQLRKMVDQFSVASVQCSGNEKSPKPETRIPETPIIVTGLPRSGTSMMMKMLEAGGVPPLCDGQRAADADNPNGYYEFEPVKQTKTDSSWLNDAAGKAVKMVYSLLYDLPTNRRYNVIFMRRDLNEILASQNQMLHNMQITSAVDDDRMSRLFQLEITKFIKWLETADHINCIQVGYNDVAAGESAPIQHINAHLGGHLNTQAMSSVVDPSLYRNRAATAAA